MVFLIGKLLYVVILVLCPKHHRVVARVVVMTWEITLGTQCNSVVKSLPD